MPTFGILVFRDVSLLASYEALKPANQRSNNAVETSNFAFAIFLI
jgi:hypothetical protein